MAFASYTNEYRGSKPPIQGCFQHTATKKYFEYRWRQVEEHGELVKDFPHLIFVGPTGTETRIAKVGKTVVHVVVDELEDGTPVIEKWYTKKFRKYHF